MKTEMERFEENTGLVYSVFNKMFANMKGEEADLIQEGMLGLWKACTTYDESKRIQFSTYAVTCIRNTMFMYVRKVKKHVGVLSLEDKVANDIEDLRLIDTLPDKTFDFENSQTLDQVQQIANDLGFGKEFELRRSGLTQIEIAKQMGVGQVIISRRLATVYAKARELLK